jgi:hypothetical protein
MHRGVVASGQDRQFAIFIRDLESIAEVNDQRDARLLVPAMTGPLFRRRRRFPQVVHERRETYDRRCSDLGCIAHHQHDMDARVDFRVPARRLGNPIKSVDLGEDLLQRTAAAQSLEEHVGSGLAQSTVRFLPDPLRNQGVDLAASHHALHEHQRVIGNTEPQVGVTSGESGNTQDAHGVFDERFRHVAKQTRLEVTTTPIRIDDLTRRGFSHCIDCEVAAAQVIFEGHVGSELRGKAAISEAHLAFDAGERVLLVRLWVQEYREFPPDGHIAVTLEFLGPRANDDPVALVNRTPEQTIPNRAAN